MVLLGIIFENDRLMLVITGVYNEWEHKYQKQCTPLPIGISWFSNGTHAGMDASAKVMSFSLSLCTLFRLMAIFPY